MRKLLLLSTLMLFFAVMANAQVSAYTFSQSSGTYTEISGGTILGTGTVDDVSYNANNIGFNFIYNGIAYTQFSVNANGFIAMGATVSSSYSAISGGSSNNVIVPLNNDLQGNASGEIRYEVQGTTPNQVLIIQWKNFRYWGTTGDDYNFQIRLYETTNTVQFVYGAFIKNATSRTMQVGLRGSSNADFNNRTTTTDWSVTTAGALNTATCALTTTVYPASGLTFTWTAPCFGPSGLSASNFTTNSADISWVAPAIPPVSYEWKVVLAGAGSGGAAVDAGTTVHPVVTDNASGLSAGTAYDLWVRSSCGGSDYSGWVGPYTFVTACNNVSSFPFMQGFESTTFQPACWTLTQVSGTGNWNRVTTGTSPTCTPHGGTAMARFNSYSFSAGTSSALISPALDFPTNNFYVSFWMFRDAGYPTTADLVNVYYNTAPNLTGATLLGTINRTMALAPVVVAEGWYEYSFPMPGGSAGTSRFVIFEAVSAFGNNIFIDDVLIDVVPTCPKPTAVTISGETQTTADIDWTEAGTATSWQVCWGEAGFTPGDINELGRAITAAHPYTIIGLQSNHLYTAHVRSICGVGDTSTWTASSVFATACADYFSVPYLKLLRPIRPSVGHQLILTQAEPSGDCRLHRIIPPEDCIRLCMHTVLPECRTAI
jgi:hypothetical protein